MTTEEAAMNTMLLVTGAVVWGASVATLAGALVWRTAERAHAAVQARREASMQLSDASLRRFVEQAAREGSL
jgi:hypothetical protein